MLGKLIKYEFKETYKFFLVMYGLLILFSFMTGLGLSKLYGSEYKTLSMILLVLVFFFCGSISRIVTYIMIMRRYYVHMLKDQAYLTHTLPVKMSHRLTAMLLVDIVWVLVSGIVLVLSAVGLTLNTDLIGIALRAIGQGIEFVAGEPLIILFAIMVLLILLVQELLSLLCFFAGISMGQTVKGHTLIGAIIFCYVLNYAKNLVVNIIVQIIPNAYLDSFVDISTKEEFVAMLGKGDVFMLGMGILFILLVLSSIYYFLAHYMMTSKLELE
jgi:hypothetical protein